MKAIGVTGGIGAGKSTVAAALIRLGIPTVDTDDVAKRVVEPGSPALEEIRRVFGGMVFDEGNRLRRQVLAEVVFRDAGARAKLEAILHPRIHAIWQSQMEGWRLENRPIGAVIIPLLFEKELAQYFARTLCVACSEALQHRRLRDRGWREDEIRDRIAAQLPMRRKMELSDCVLWNESPFGVLDRQLREFLKSESLYCPGTG